MVLVLDDSPSACRGGRLCWRGLQAFDHQEEEQSPMHASLILRAARRGWWLALVSAGLGAAGGLAAAAATPPLWTASATLGVTGPDVQDTVTGALVTEMVAKKAADLADDPAVLAERLPGRDDITSVRATVPFGSSDVALAVTATTRDGARAGVLAVTAEVVDRIKVVDAHVALSPTRQRVPTEFGVRLARIGPVLAPGAPGSPAPWLNAAAGLLAGAAAGLGLAALREFLTRPAGRPGGAHRGASSPSRASRVAVDVAKANDSVEFLMKARGGHSTC